MGIRKTAMLIIFSLLGFRLFAVPLGTQLSLAFRTPIFPSDPVIGPLVPENKGPIENLTAEALKKTWSPQWVEQYVKEENRYGFAKSYNDLLSSLLPVHYFSLAQAQEQGQVVQQLVRIGKPGDFAITYGTFIWEPTEDGTYYLVSISLTD
jgi:hypothetical protein